MIGAREYLNLVDCFEADRHAQDGYGCELLGHFLTGGDRFVVQEASPTQVEELRNEAVNLEQEETLLIQEPPLDAQEEPLQIL